MSSSDRSTYTLLIATGQSPQVITETVWSLARQHRPPLVPVGVDVITTAVGEAHVRARLLGEAAHDPVRGGALEAKDRWGPFCEDVLGLAAPVPLRLHVPMRHDLAVDDVLGPGDDAAFADLCYQLVRDRTQGEAPPCIGSIAGGRKTMSAHLMTAFSVYARPQDRLTHILVDPDPPPGKLRQTFFYPTEATRGRVRLHRVDVAFPRLQGLLRQTDLQLPDGRADLRALLDALEPHAAREVEPARFEVELGDREAQVRALAADGDVLGVCTLTASEAAIFLVFANALEGGGGAVRATDLYDDAGVQEAMRHPVHEQRVLIEGYCNVFADQRVAWMSNNDLSRALHRVNDNLGEAPILERYLAITSQGRGPSLQYAWPEALPAPLTVRSDASLERWPLEHVPVAA